MKTDDEDDARTVAMTIARNLNYRDEGKKIFRVEIEQDVTTLATVFVLADDEDDAENKALDQAEGLIYHLEKNSYNPGFYINSVEEIEV